MADYDAIRAEFAGHPHVTVEPIGSLPPERYRLTYRLKSVVLDGDQPQIAEEHRAELSLSLGYPRVGPVVVPKSPVFHPNIDDTKYCIADYWSAGQTLVDVIRKVGDMLQFRVHNIGSPLNATAARWVAENPSIFPIGDVDLGAPELEIDVRPTSSASESRSASAQAGADDDGDEPRRRTEIVL